MCAMEMSAPQKGQGRHGEGMAQGNLAVQSSAALPSCTVDSGEVAPSRVASGVGREEGPAGLWSEPGLPLAIMFWTEESCRWE